MKYYWQEGRENGILVRVDKCDDDEIPECYIDFTFLKKNPMKKINKRMDRKFGPLLIEKKRAVKFLSKIKNDYEKCKEMYEKNGSLREFQRRFGEYDSPIYLSKLIECCCIEHCTLMNIRCSMDNTMPMDMDSNPMFEFILYRIHPKRDRREQEYASLSPNEFTMFIEKCLEMLNE